MAAAQEARTRIHEAAYQQLHRDPYRAELGPSILASIPPDLDALMEQVVMNAVARLGFRVEAVRGMRTYAIDFGNEALVDSLPGVPGGASFIGSFDREYAVEDETIDFFASGHALVEGLLAHFEEDPKGRVARVELHHPGQTGTGLVAFYKDGAHVRDLSPSTWTDASGPIGLRHFVAGRRGSREWNRMMRRCRRGRPWCGAWVPSLAAAARTHSPRSSFAMRRPWTAGRATCDTGHWTPLRGARR